jgi:hypothetical protein
MLTDVVVSLRTIGLIRAGHRAVALENVGASAAGGRIEALRQTSTLRTRDRIF